MPAHYIGRFAPSPTGPLHFGSLVSALASYLDAKSNHGQWLIRLEDVDQTRCKAEYADVILDCLASYGLISDQTILRQSQRSALYQEYLVNLQQQGQVFPCNCTRQQITQLGGRHPNTCNGSQLAPHSWRLLCPHTTYSLDDAVQGPLTFTLNQEDNAPILKRKDGLFSYQLAVVVDDHLQGITHVVRGADLLDTTAQQLHLYHLLGWAAPKFTHIPLILDQAGRKISKQNHAIALEMGSIDTLKSALSYLQLAPLTAHRIEDLLMEATQKWQPKHLPPALSLTIQAEDAHLSQQG